MATNDVKDYDFIRFTVTDIHGISRGKTVPAKVAERFFKNGIHVYAGLTAVGPLGEVIKLSKIDELNHGNVTIKPDLSTLHSLPPSRNGRHSVGEYLCESYWLQDDTPQQCCPRAVARTQLEQLKTMGYKLLTGTELEFHLFNAETRKPVFDGEDFLGNLNFTENDDYLYNLQNEAAKAGVEIEMMHTEWGAGQYEFTQCPQWGIKGPDQTFIFRQIVKETAMKHVPKFEASFLSRQNPQAKGGSFLQLNHSLWREASGDEGEDINVFYDPNKQDNYSDIGRWWVGGLLKHAPALCALYTPTVHCYRSLSQSWIATLCNWGFDDRLSAFRVTTCGPKQSYIEVRGATCLSNPYLLLAGTVAAGIDGIRNRIEPPAPSDRSAPELPRTLGEALKELEADTVMVQALGEEFVDWFVSSKKQIELEKLKTSDPTDDKDVTGWENERKLYKNI